MRAESQSVGPHEPEDERKKLTQRGIDALRPVAGTRFLAWDTDVKGFGVRVGGGAKSYVLKFRIETKSSRVTVSPFDRA